MNENVKAEKAPRSVRSDIYDWLQCIVMAIVICVLFFSFIVRLVDVVGSSMYPTLENGDKILVSNLFYTPKQGDIIVFRHGGKILVKRIVAVGGDTVSLNDQDGSFAVNQELATATRILTVPKDYFFVVGDNRQNSFDSRFWEEPFVGAKWVLARVKF